MPWFSPLTERRPLGLDNDTSNDDNDNCIDYNHDDNGNNDQRFVRLTIAKG